MGADWDLNESGPTHQKKWAIYSEAFRNWVPFLANTRIPLEFLLWMQGAETLAEIQHMLPAPPRRRVRGRAAAWLWRRRTQSSSVRVTGARR